MQPSHTDQFDNIIEQLVNLNIEKAKVIEELEALNIEEDALLDKLKEQRAYSRRQAKIATGTQTSRKNSANESYSVRTPATESTKSKPNFAENISDELTVGNTVEIINRYRGQKGVIGTVVKITAKTVRIETKRHGTLSKRIRNVRKI